MAGEFFQDDIDAGAFFDTDDFAYSTTYTPDGGSPVPVNGQFIDLNMNINPFTGENESNTDALFVCASSEVPGVRQGDTFLIDSIIWVVKVIPTSTSNKISRIGINRQ